MKTKNATTLERHIIEDVNYPATKQKLIMTCNGMSDIAKEDKEWLKKNLPEKAFETANEVMQALGLKHMRKAAEAKRGKTAAKKRGREFYKKIGGKGGKAKGK